MRDELYARLGELGDRTVLVHGDVAHTYAELLARVDAVRADLYAHGVAPHEPVVLHGDVSFGSVAALLALAVQRAVVIPVVDLTPELEASVVSSCGATRVLRVDGGGDLAVPTPPGPPPARPPVL